MAEQRKMMMQQCMTSEARERCKYHNDLYCYND